MKRHHWLASVLLCAIAAFSANESSAAVLYVAPGGNVQSAINSAQPGDEIVLESGALYTGALTFPDKGGTIPIVVRSTQPAPDRRITPDDRALLASLGSGSTSPAALITGSHWHFIGLAFRPTTNGEYDIIRVNGSATDILLDRLLIEGGPSGQKRAVAVNAGATTITRSHIRNIWKTGQDSQGICGWNGPGPFTIIDNFIEAASENIMFGGAASSSPDRVPSDILVEGNHLTKNLGWRGVSGTYNVKNLFELKSARRVTVRNNLLEHNWVDGQAGSAIVITPRNPGGTAPWSVVEDVVFENNTVNDTVHVFNITGYDDAGGLTGQTRRLTFRNNLFTNVTGTLLQVGGEVGEITLDHNTSMNAGTLMKLYRGSILQADGTKRPGQYAVGTFTVLNSLMVYGSYGVWGEGSAIGTDALEDHTLSYDWRRNVVAGERGWNHTFPPDTQKPTMEFYYAQFNPDYSLVTGSPYIGAALDGSDLGKLFGTVSPPVNEAPVASFSTSCTSHTCNFTDASTDVDGSIVSWSWDFGDGTTSNEQNPAHTYVNPGSYQVTLNVTDDGSATGSTGSTVTIAPQVNQVPVASFTTSCSSSTCTFSDASTDADGSIASWAWDFGDGTTSSEQNPVHAYAGPGTYQVTLVVTDDDGASGSTVASVTIAPTEPPPNTAPVASFTFSCTGFDCGFTDTSTDADGSIVAWSWTFGDGTGSSLQNPTHTYTAGNFKVMLTVTDDDGATASVTRAVNIRRPRR